MRGFGIIAASFSSSSVGSKPIARVPSRPAPPAYESERSCSRRRTRAAARRVQQARRHRHRRRVWHRPHRRAQLPASDTSADSSGKTRCVTQWQGIRPSPHPRCPLEIADGHLDGRADFPFSKRMNGMSLSLATVRIAVTQASPILPRAEDGIGISRRQQDSAPAGSPRGAGFRNLGGMRSLATYSQNTESLAPLTFSQLDFFTTVWLSHIVSFATFGMSRVTSGSPNRLGELRHGLRSGVAAIGKLMSDIGRLCQIGRLYALPPEATAHPGTNELRRIVNVVVLLVISIALTGSAWAQAIDRCDDVLKQDLFNRSSSQSEQKQSAQDAQSAAFFSQDWNKAYDEYSKAYDDEKKQGTSGHLDGHYGVIGGAADFAHTYDRKLTGDEFKKDFTEAQKMYQGSSSSSSANESSLIGIYSSSVRDPNTIKAWETCMSTS